MEHQEEPPTSRRFALCTEFGAGYWRMVLFFPLEEICIRPFPGAQKGKLFERMADGEFKLIEGNCQNMEKMEVKLDGLEEGICLKICLPVFFPPSPHSFGFILGQSAANGEKFISSIDPAITGHVLCDIGHMERQSVYYMAFVSLTSFNSPIETKGANGLHWSIRSIEDILGRWDKKALDPPPVERKASTSSSGNECPRMIGPRKERKKAEAEVERHQAVVICWKRSREDSFFLRFGQEEEKPPIRLQTNNNNLKIETKLGGWYWIEYSMYTKSDVHMLIHKIGSANEGQKVFETREKDGNVEFNLTIQREKNGDGFEACRGSVKVVDVPKELMNTAKLFAWCSLKGRIIEGENQFEFKSSNYNNNIVVVELTGMDRNNPVRRVQKVGKRIGWTDQNFTDTEDDEGSIGESGGNSSKATENIGAQLIGICASAKPADDVNSKPIIDAADLTTLDGSFGAASRRRTALSAKSAEIEDRSTKWNWVEEGREGDNGKLEKAKEEEPMAEIMKYEDEVAVPEHLLEVILGQLNDYPNCRVKRSQESENSIQIVGNEKQDVKECVKRVRALREELKLRIEKMPIEECKLGKNGALEKAGKNGALEEAGKNGALEEMPIGLEEVLSGHATELDWLAEVEKAQANMEFDDELAANEKTKGAAQQQKKSTVGRETPKRLSRPSPSPNTKANHRLTHSRSCSSLPKAKIYQQMVDVPKKFHGNLIGKNGSHLEWLRTNFNVRLEIPTEYSLKEEVEIEGTNADKVNGCKQHIQAMLRRLQNEQCDEMAVPRRIMPFIIGKEGNKIQKLRDQFPNVDIDAAPRNREGDGVIMFRGNKAEVAQLRIHLIDLIAELTTKHYEYKLPLPTDDPNHNLVEFIKFLRGSNCDKIRSINQRFPDVKVDFPIPEENDEPVIWLDGPKERVDEVKRLLENKIEELKAVADVYVPVEEKYFEKFLRLEAKLMREIKEEHKKCTIYLEKSKERIEIRGKPEHAEKARRRIEEILAQMNPMVRHISIPSKNHWHLRTHLSEIRDKHSVKCILPRDGDNIELIGPSEGKLDAAERDLLALCPITEQMEVPRDYRRTLLNERGERIMQLQKEHRVEIIAPAPKENGQLTVMISISGTAQNVRACLTEIRAELPVTRMARVPCEFRGSFIGRGGELLKQMERKHAVVIQFQPEQSIECDQVAVTGRSECMVEACLDEIRVKLAQLEREKAQKSFSMTMSIPEHLRGKLIGTGGKNVRELEEQFGVKIWGSITGLTITGREDQCRLCQAAIGIKVIQLASPMNNIPRAPTLTERQMPSTNLGGQRRQQVPPFSSSTARRQTNEDKSSCALM